MSTDNDAIGPAPGQTGQAQMRPRARLISLIGEELISDEPVAVVELVKNAYDADAAAVSVVFGGDTAEKPSSLVISDDGSGMTLDTVLHGWLEPGTVLKKQAKRSPGGRVYQGAKGVGRFAAARLAETLLLETRPPELAEGVIVLLNWGQFDDESYLDEVSLEYALTDNSDLRPGTRLTLETFRKTWSKEDYEAMHDRLSRLISPFDDDQLNFQIHLDIPWFPELTGRVEPHDLTRNPTYHLEGRLTDDGTFSGRIKYCAEGQMTTLREFEKHQLAPKGRHPACGALEVEIRAWDRDRKGLTRFMQMFDSNLTGIRRILNAYCGVSIYRDGFRVHPYGEKGNDWLNLDNRSRQVPTRRLANNQIIAAVRLFRDKNPQLMDRTTREGLIHNDAYEELVDWFTMILALLEEERYKLRPREERKPEQVEGLFEPFDLSDVVREANSSLGKEHPVAKMVVTKDAEIREGVQRLQEFYSRLLLTAGLGQQVDVVIHEIGAPLSRLNRELNGLAKRLKKDMGTSYDTYGGYIERCRAYIEQLVALRRQLEPKSAANRLRATTFNVWEEIEANIQLFSSLLSKQNISVGHSQPSEAVIVNMPRSAMGQIVSNVLDNCIYWLTRHHGDGGGGQIHVELTSQTGGFRIRICDDGPGIPEQDREVVFDPYYTTKATGMGLGLYIARQVIEPFGRLVLCDDCRLSGACFEAIFERKIGW